VSSWHNIQPFTAWHLGYLWTYELSCNIEALFAGYKVEQQGYRTCMSLLKLSEQYTPERLEAACGAALKYTPRPSYKAIQTILKSGRDKPGETQLPSEPSKYGFTRGSEYYKGGRG